MNCPFGGGSGNGVVGWWWLPPRWLLLRGALLRNVEPLQKARAKPLEGLRHNRLLRCSASSDHLLDGVDAQLWSSFLQRSGIPRLGGTGRRTRRAGCPHRRSGGRGLTATPPVGSLTCSRRGAPREECWWGELARPLNATNLGTDCSLGYLYPYILQDKTTLFISNHSMLGHSRGGRTT